MSALAESDLAILRGWSAKIDRMPQPFRHIAQSRRIGYPRTEMTQRQMTLELILSLKIQLENAYLAQPGAYRLLSASFHPSNPEQRFQMLASINIAGADSLNPIFIAPQIQAVRSRGGGRRLEISSEHPPILHLTSNDPIWVCTLPLCTPRSNCQYKPWLPPLGLTPKPVNPPISDSPLLF